MNITLPELSLVVLIGASGSGKSSFARKHFKPTEILSSDFCRGLVSDDENNQAATGDAFELLHYLARKRLSRGLLTVVDATNVRPEDRKPLVEIAREFHCLPVAIVMDVPQHVCHERNQGRADRDFGPHVIRSQHAALRRGLYALRREGFRHVFTLRSAQEADTAVVERQPLWNNLKHEAGPFDIVGDVHGCFDELVELLERLGYVLRRDEGRAEGDWDVSWSGGTSVGHKPASTSVEVAGLGLPAEAGDVAGSGAAVDRAPHPVAHAPGTWPARKLVFVGDLVDRGPKVPGVLRLVMRLVGEGKALCVPGNHDIKLVRALAGNNVQVTHGLAESLAQLAPEPPEFRESVRAFLDELISHYVLDGGRLVVAHAGMKESMQGRGSGAVRDFALFGETTGETDEFGLPIRYNWAAEYRGKAAVVYGHTPVPDPQWLNNTINIDTGCVFGGSLTALRWPERELVGVRARHTYAEPKRPFLPEHEAAPSLSAQQVHDDVLDLSDVFGKRIIETRLHKNVIVREGNAAAALEVISRFACDPRWLIYLPPTMSPCETSQRPDLLEHPAEVFAYYRFSGVARVVCQEKHMGSRAVVIVCRDAQVARARFGVTTGESGICFTRTGRRFFDDQHAESQLLGRVRAGVDGAGLWDELATDWVCLDCELMPWSAKAQALLRDQYAPVGSAARAGLAGAVEVLGLSAAVNPEATALRDAYTQRLLLADRYVDAYRHYCWPVNSIDDIRLAPFHVLATEGHVHTDRDHLWHMALGARIAAPASPVVMATNHVVVDLSDPESEATATAWWEHLVASGGEGMVVKPLEFIAKGPRGLLQPAIKCRGPEYLRIIYGPEYSLPVNLARLRSRGLGAKRSLALREFSLGVEALERFARREPLRRVHECVFGVLAMESEAVDPRL